jgi:methylated-DNA-[protein]-cysteine S-methyltransferase
MGTVGGSSIKTPAIKAGSIKTGKTGRAVFDTPLGRCGIAWSEKGLTRLALLAGAEGEAPWDSDVKSDVKSAPDWVREAIRRITLHVGGNPQDLTGIPIDMDGISPFFRRVYEAARAVGPGRTVSYAELAGLAGSPKATRAVGQAMARNPFCIIVPCHRVLTSGGGLGGFSAPGGVVTKARLLELER